MRVSDIIIKKRDGGVLSNQEIQYLVDGFTSGAIPEYQTAAFLMAVFFRGMTAPELAVFTTSMMNSGIVVDLSHIHLPRIDKHSTGGVGDKITIPLVPTVAACGGIAVPTIAGRALGHTGGTVDKLEAIPGFNTSLDVESYKRITKEIHCCMIGQTAEIAPADKKLYALRDVTGTVECIPLLASSILSKKLAEGIDGIVLDVKFGSGAFLKDFEQSKLLAHAMADLVHHVGKKVVVRMTSAGQPIGVMVGNALEIRESIDVLKGKGPSDTVALVVEFGAEMLLLGDVVPNMEEGRKRIQEALQNGTALAKFKELIKAQGGDSRVLQDDSIMPWAKNRVAFTASKSGYISAINTMDVGIASLVLGAGRQKITDNIDHSVGLEVHARYGDWVNAGDKICTLHTNGVGDDDALALLTSAYQISDDAPAPFELFGPRIVVSN